MNAWLKRKDGPDEVVKVIPDADSTAATLVYNLYLAYENHYLGRILFDDQGYWIYDGDELTVAEQEQMGKFIHYNMELLWNG